MDDYDMFAEDSDRKDMIVVNNDDQRPKTSIERLVEFEKTLQKDSESTEAYLGILQLPNTQLGTIEQVGFTTEELGKKLKLIVRYFQFFPDLSETAFDACEAILGDCGCKVRSEAFRNQLPLLCKDAPPLLPRIIAVLNKYLKYDDPRRVEREAVQHAFTSLFKLDENAFLTALLTEGSLDDKILHGKLLDFIKDKLFPLKTGLKPQEDIERSITALIRKSLEGNAKGEAFFNCMDFLRSLSINGAEENMKELVEVVEGRACLGDSFDVSNKVQTDRWTSCLQTGLLLYERGAAPTRKFLDFLHNEILPKFDKLAEGLKLSLLKVLAEISAHNTTDEFAQKMLPLIVRLLKTEEITDFTYVECLLYMFHHLAPTAPTITHRLCGYKIETIHASDIPLEAHKEFTESLTRAKEKTKARMKTLAKEMRYHDEPNSNAQGRDDFVKVEETKTEIRSCDNIQAMTKLLLENPVSFIRDTSVVKLSWREARKALPVRRIRRVTGKAPKRPVALHSLPWSSQADLKHDGFCNLSYEQAQSLVQSSGLQLPQGQRSILSLERRWPDRYSLLGNRKRDTSESTSKSWKTISGKVRDQQYHILCWAYVASDLVSGARRLHKLEKDNVPLCTWYMCAFCYPDSLNKDEARKPGHHCYGAMIEDGLVHIKKHGIPTEVVKTFDCKDYLPPSAEQPLKEERKIKGFRRIDTFEEALLELEKQPIGADLISFAELFKKGKKIYRGPKSSQYSRFMGYHAVIIVDVVNFDGEWVAKCKMSNGVVPGDKGYVYVSLSTVYLVVGADGEKKSSARGTTEPMHLLSNFIVPEMDNNREEEEGEKPAKRSRIGKDEMGGEEMER